MPRFSPYLGIVTAIVLGVIFAAASGSVTVERAPAPQATTSSSTVFVVPTITLPPLVFPDLELPTEKSTVVDAPATPKPVPVSTSITVTPVPAPPPQLDSVALDASASALRAALVNIMCYAPSGSGLHSTSGSGVFVDPKGIILTNAHVALHFLLADRGVSCTIRSGNPAIDRYKAELMYLSSAWIDANADILTETAPSGTGEYDFAFLAVTKSANGSTLPDVFPSIPLAILPSVSDTPVVIASYGAQFLQMNQIQSTLYPTVVFGSVKDVFTFTLNTIDVLALGGSAAAQEGSSGGGVADASGALVGTITTSTTEGTTDTRSLDAISTSYIRAAYASETGQALDLLLEKSPAQAAADFAPQISTLESILTAHLP